MCECVYVHGTHVHNLICGLWTPVGGQEYVLHHHNLCYYFLSWILVSLNIYVDHRSPSIKIVKLLVIFKIHFWKDFIYLLLEKGEGKEKERKWNINVWEISPVSCLSHAPNQGTWLVTQACALNGDWTRNLSVCRPALNPLSHTSQS